MKSYKILSVVIACVFSSQIISAQLVVNADEDIHRCSVDSSVQFDARVSGGSEPYIYE